LKKSNEKDRKKKKRNLIKNRSYSIGFPVVQTKESKGRIRKITSCAERACLKSKTRQNSCLLSLDKI